MENCCKCNKSTIVNKDGECFHCASVAGIKYVEKKKALTLEQSKVIWLFTGVLDIIITCMILAEARMGWFALSVYALAQGGLVVFMVSKELNNYFYGLELVHPLDLLIKVILCVDIPYFFAWRRLEMGGFLGKALMAFIRTKVEGHKVMPGLSGLIQLLSDFWNKYLFRPITVQIGLIVLWLIIRIVISRLNKNRRMNWHYPILNEILEKEEQLTKLEDIPEYKSFYTESYLENDYADEVEDALIYGIEDVLEEDAPEEVVEEVKELLCSQEKELEMSREAKKIYLKVVEDYILHELKMNENSRWVDEIEETAKMLEHSLKIPETITLSGKSKYVTKGLFELTACVVHEINEPLENFMDRRNALDPSSWIASFRGVLTSIFPEYYDDSYEEHRNPYIDRPRVALAPVGDGPIKNYFMLYIETKQLIDEYRHWRSCTKQLVDYAETYLGSVLSEI